jgi:hypothetical protein
MSTISESIQALIDKSELPVKTIVLSTIDTRYLNDRFDGISTLVKSGTDPQTTVQLVKGLFDLFLNVDPEEHTTTFGGELCLDTESIVMQRLAGIPEFTVDVVITPVRNHGYRIGLYHRVDYQAETYWSSIRSALIGAVPKSDVERNRYYLTSQGWGGSFDAADVPVHFNTRKPTNQSLIGNSATGTLALIQKNCLDDILLFNENGRIVKRSVTRAYVRGEFNTLFTEPRFCDFGLERLFLGSPFRIGDDYVTTNLAQVPNEKHVATISFNSTIYPALNKKYYVKRNATTQEPFEYTADFLHVVEELRKAGVTAVFE